VVEAVVDRIEPYGFFLQLKGGGRGMVHVSEIGPAPEGADPQKPPGEQFPKGTKVKVAVLEIDAEHRIRLSRAAVPDLEKGTTAESYLKHKTQHELEERLLRSAAKPVRAKVPARGPRPNKRAATASTAPAATAGATAEARPPRRERPSKPRPGGPPGGPSGGQKRPEKSGGLGTLGDLLKLKLQQRKS
jgi:predicted RNA-binding protein with RPS1 domain